MSIAAYLFVAVLANWNAWAHGFAHTVQLAGPDSAEEIWFVAQTPWSFLHGVNPLANNWLNAPTGVDLMDNTTMPLLGLLGAPVTVLLGPIAAFNVLAVFAFSASATTFFLMARRFVAWWPAAFFGGLLYAFSPFAVAVASTAHLFLLFQAIPPLIILIFDGFRRGAYRSPVGYGLALGGCFVAQFYVSTEATASFAVMTIIGLACAWLLLVWRRTTTNWVALAKMGLTAGSRHDRRHRLRGVGHAGGPQHITGPAQTPTAIAGLSSDPLGLVLPTINQHFTFGHASLGDSFVAERDANWRIGFEAPSENGTYVGLPLLLVLVVGTLLLRRNRFAVFSAVMAVVAMVLSMGTYLHVDGHLTGVPMPFIVLAHLPLLESGIASRYTGLFWLFAALLFALIVDRVHSVTYSSVGGGSVSWASRWCASHCSRWYRRGRTRRRQRSFQPGSPAPHGRNQLEPPRSSTRTQRAQDPSAMLWQSMADMTFRMPGGYAVFATPSGTASFYATPSSYRERWPNARRVKIPRSRRGHPFGSRL